MYHAPAYVLAFAVLTVSLISTPAFAYIGPGAGLSVIGTVISLVGAVLLLVIGFVWYPIKRLLRGNKEVKPPIGGQAARRSADEQR